MQCTRGVHTCTHTSDTAWRPHTVLTGLCMLSRKGYNYQPSHCYGFYLNTKISDYSSPPGKWGAKGSENGLVMIGSSESHESSGWEFIPLLVLKMKIDFHCCSQFYATRGKGATLKSEPALSSTCNTCYLITRSYSQHYLVNIFILWQNRWHFENWDRCHTIPKAHSKLLKMDTLKGKPS